MNNTRRLSLAELKSKADQTNILENLEAIKGEGLFNCHGAWGARGKRLGGHLEKAAFAVGTAVIIDKLTD